MDFSGGLVLPVSAVLQRPVKFYRAGAGTIVNAAAAIPAFIGMQYHRRFAFLGVGYINIYLADFYTVIAPIANIRIEDHRIVRCRNIRNGDYFFLSHLFLQKPVRSKRYSFDFESIISAYIHRCSLYYGLHTDFSCYPKRSAAIFRFLLCRFLI
jgi:hypothetical protein